MKSRTYYATQSAITDPGEMAWWLADLPADVDGLRRVARELVIHYRAEDPVGQGIPEARLSEIDTRYVDQILRRLHELDNRSLTEGRPPQQRLVGCCRDFTVTFLAMARHAGIPARSRVGFATYFLPDFDVDHVVAEVWDAAADRWRLVDAELGDSHIDPTDGTPVDGLDVPRDRFLVAGDAWSACRAGAADPERFLVDPGLDIPGTRSWPQLRYNVIQDLAALNKVEMLLWDNWGLTTRQELSPDELDLVDRVAAATRAGDTAFAEIRSLYQNEPELRVPDSVTSFSPLTGEPREVRLRL